MKNCGNCNYWKSFKPQKECKGMESWNFTGSFKIGNCKNKKLEYDTYPNEADNLCYGDSEAYSAYLITAEKFGCIHWARKNET
jgi:hypothetical protein